MKIWIDDVMSNITTSLNDMHQSRMYKLIQRKCIEKIQTHLERNYEEKEINSLILSNTQETSNDEHCGHLLNKLLQSGQDKDNPHIKMSTWIKDNRLWQPQPPAVPNIERIHKVKEVQEIDSGAN